MFVENGKKPKEEEEENEDDKDYEGISSSKSIRRKIANTRSDTDNDSFIYVLHQVRNILNNSIHE